MQKISTFCIDIYNISFSSTIYEIDITLFGRFFLYHDVKVSVVHSTLICLVLTGLD